MCGSGCPPIAHSDIKQFDLRIWGYYGEEEYNGIGSLDMVTVRLSTYCAGQLASMADPEIMIICLFDWHHSAMAGPEEQSIFEPLPDHLRRKLQRFRDKSQFEDDDDDSISYDEDEDEDEDVDTDHNDEHEQQSGR